MRELAAARLKFQTASTHLQTAIEHKDAAELEVIRCEQELENLQQSTVMPIPNHGAQKMMETTHRIAQSLTNMRQNATFTPDGMVQLSPMMLV